MTKMEVSTDADDSFGFPPPVYDSAFEMYEVIEAGVPVRNLEKLASFIAPGNKQWKFRIVSATTYYRCKKARKRLSPEIGQKVARIATTARAVRQIFQHDCAARTFLNRPHYLLGSKAPIDLAMKSDAGARAVTELLFAGAYASRKN